jgi:hypothetical protein
MDKSIHRHALGQSETVPIVSQCKSALRWELRRYTLLCSARYENCQICWTLRNFLTRPALFHSHKMTIDGPVFPFLELNTFSGFKSMAFTYIIVVNNVLNARKLCANRARLGSFKFNLKSQFYLTGKKSTLHCFYKSGQLQVFGVTNHISGRKQTRYKSEVWIRCGGL